MFFSAGAPPLLAAGQQHNRMLIVMNVTHTFLLELPEASMYHAARGGPDKFGPRSAGEASDNHVFKEATLCLGFARSVSNLSVHTT